MLDEIWIREFSDLKPPGTPQEAFPLMLYMNAHAKIRVSLEMAFSHCLPEARSILRDAIEFAAHAHAMLANHELQNVWLNKSDELEAFKNAFERNKKKGIFKGLAELQEMWGRFSETGSHANINAICENFSITEDGDGKSSWALSYTGSKSEELFVTGVFTMLLVCFKMEELFFIDYSARLNLDHILIDMRRNFQIYKETVREVLKVRHNITMPEPKGVLVNP